MARDITGEFKLCVGQPHEFAALCHAMMDTGITPDFITVDGAEGGTGAAPLEFQNSVGFPLAEGLRLLDSLLIGAGLRDEFGPTFAMAAFLAAAEVGDACVAHAKEELSGGGDGTVGTQWMRGRQDVTQERDGVGRADLGGNVQRGAAVGLLHVDARLVLDDAPDQLVQIAVEHARRQLVTQMRGLLLTQWRAHRHVCENFSPKREWSDCTGMKFYHWGGLTGYIGLLEAGFYGRH